MALVFRLQHIDFRSARGIASQRNGEPTGPSSLLVSTPRGAAAGVACLWLPLPNASQNGSSRPAASALGGARGDGLDILRGRGVPHKRADSRYRTPSFQRYVWFGARREDDNSPFKSQEPDRWS
jgi:hypothetical protein